MLRNVNLKFILVRMQMRMLLKIKDPSGLKRKDFKGPKKKMAVGKRVGKPQGKVAKGCGAIMADRKKKN